MIIDSAYKDHQVYTKISEYADFYKSLSFSIFGFITKGTKVICKIDSCTYSSVQGTMESIKDILVKGRINDAYALLRKYYDSVIMNVYTSLYLNDNFNLDNIFVEKIDKWVQGKEPLPKYRIMSQYIRHSDKLTEINLLLYSDDRYKNIRNNCNDHTHCNFYQNVLSNDNEIYLNNRLELLNSFSKDLEDIFILHFAYIFYLNDHYMMSSDYIDSLDCGITPEEDSQYWVAPFIQKIFDEVIKINRKDLADKIKKKTLMELK